LTPKFLFGVNGDIPNSLHVIEDKKLLYIAGHNVILYNIDERTQFFIPGSENSAGINSISVSPSKRFLAICEIGDVRAMCTIYDITSRKKKRVLPENEYETNDFTTKTFLSAAFSPKNEKQHLITLAGEPDWSLLFWQWDQFKCLFKIDIGQADLSSMAHLNKKNWQCSVAMLSSELNVIVTGPNTYKFLKVDSNFCSAEMSVTSLDTSDIQVEPVGEHYGVSTNYTCHTWSVDTQRPIVCTDMGDILLLD
jgi:WD40 repeat protein